jgi:hypothetical protein
MIVISLVVLAATMVGFVVSVATSARVQAPPLEKADAKPLAKQDRNEAETRGGARDSNASAGVDSSRVSIVVGLTDSLKLPGLACNDVRVELSPSAPEDHAPLHLSSEGELEFTTPCDAPAFERWLQSGVSWKVKVGVTLGWYCDSEYLLTNTVVNDPAVAGERHLRFEIPVDTSALLNGNVLLRGRVTHSSGHTFAERDIRLRRPAWENAYIATRTGPDGEFGVFERLWANENTADQSEEWRIQVPNGSDSYTHAIADSFSAGNPARQGDVLDFGAIVLGGGLLKVSAPSLEQDGVCSLELRSGSYMAEVGFPPGSLPASILLVPGRYFWKFEAVPSGPDRSGFFTRQSTRSPLAPRGQVDLVDGELTELVVELPAPQYLQVFVEGLAEHEVVYVLAQTGEDEKPRVVAVGGVSPITILTNGMTDLRVHATTDELESDAVAVPVGAGQITLTLSKLREQPGHPSRERIMVQFRAPDGLQLNPSIVCECDDGTRVSHTTAGQFWFVAFGDHVEEEQPEGTYACTVRPGTWKVSVYGGAEYGYEGGLLSGPVTVVVPPGEEVAVEMPDPAPPPRSSRSNLFLRFTCRDSWIDLHAPLKLHDGSEASSQWWRCDQPLPVTLLDGSAEIALVADDSDPSQVSVGADLPARVRVRALRPMDGLRAQLWSLAESWPRPECSANMVEGEAGLWLPAGPAHLVVTEDGAVIHQTDVDIPAEGTVEVEFEHSSGQVDFTRDFSAQDAHWHLFRQSASGWEMVELYFSTAARTLPAGRYAAVSCSASWFGVVNFDIRAGEETQVNLAPQTGFKRGPVSLNLPPAYSGEDGELRIDVVPAGIAEYRLDDASLKRVARPVSVRLTADGATVLDMPLGGDFILVGSVSCGGVTYALQQSVTVPDESGAINANWREPRATGE